MVEVEIAGQMYRIATPYDPDYNKKIVAHLNGKLDVLKKRGKNRPALQSLLLVVLDVIDDCFQAEARRETERAEMKKELAELLAEVDRQLVEFRTPGPPEGRVSAQGGG